MAKAISCKCLTPSHYKAIPRQISRTTSVFHRMVGSMCPLSRNTYWVPLPRANAYIPIFGKMGPFGKVLPLLPTCSLFEVPSTSGHIGLRLRTNGKALREMETFWLTHCLLGGMAKAIPYKCLAASHYKAFSCKYLALPRCFSVRAKLAKIFLILLQNGNIPHGRTHGGCFL